MASSFSSDLKLELMVTGENAGTWGDKTNNNLNLVQQAVAGFEQVTLSSGGTLALVMTDGTISNARNLVIKFATASIAASTVCTIPDSIEKFYIFDCTGLTNPTNLTIKTASGTGFSPNAAKIFAAYADGTNLNEISLDTLGGTIAAANLTGTISTSQIADHAVTFAKIQETTTANRVIGAASAGDVGEVQVATDMIADDAVNADKLANTTVTAGSYTAASITVDAQGRLTAASSGSGAANFKCVKLGIGPASGTIATGPTASKFQAFAIGGGGGGGRGGGSNGGGSGGAGGFGFFSGPVAADTTFPFSIGGGGAAAPGPQGSRANTPGSAGGATNVQNLLTANGGNGGNGGMPQPPQPPGNPGNAGSPTSDTVMISRQVLFLPSSSNINQAGGGGGGGGSSQGAGSPGSAGGLMFFTNEG